MGGKSSKTAMTLSAREVISRRHPNSNPASEATVPREPAKVSDLASSPLPSPPVLGKYDMDPEMLSKVAKGFNIKTTPIKVRIQTYIFMNSFKFFTYTQTPTLANSNMEHSAAAIRLKNDKDAAQELNPIKNLKFTEDEMVELLKKFR